MGSWAYAGGLLLFLYFASPLSTLGHVLQHWDSSSLQLPMCIMNMFHGTLWWIYGLVIADAFVWIPSAAGALLGLLQTTLRLCIPRKDAQYAEMCGSSLHLHCSLVCTWFTCTENGVRHLQSTLGLWQTCSVSMPAFASASCMVGMLLGLLIYPHNQGFAVVSGY
jgi:hypothetical protein